MIDEKYIKIVNEKDLENIKYKKYYFGQKTLKIGDIIIFSINETEFDDESRQIEVQLLVLDKNSGFFVKLTE